MEGRTGRGPPQTSTMYPGKPKAASSGLHKSTTVHATPAKTSPSIQPAANGSPSPIRMGAPQPSGGSKLNGEPKDSNFFYASIHKAKEQRSQPPPKLHKRVEKEQQDLARDTLKAELIQRVSRWNIVWTTEIDVIQSLVAKLEEATRFSEEQKREIDLWQKETMMLKDTRAQLVKKNGLLHAALTQLKQEKEGVHQKRSPTMSSVAHEDGNLKEERIRELEEEVRSLMERRGSAATAAHGGGSETVRTIELRQELEAAMRKIETLRKANETLAREKQMTSAKLEETIFGSIPEKQKTHELVIQRLAQENQQYEKGVKVLSEECNKLRALLERYKKKEGSPKSKAAGEDDDEEEDAAVEGVVLVKKENKKLKHNMQILMMELEESSVVIENKKKKIAALEEKVRKLKERIDGRHRRKEISLDSSEEEERDDSEEETRASNGRTKMQHRRTEDSSKETSADAKESKKLAALLQRKRHKIQQLRVRLEGMQGKLEKLIAAENRRWKERQDGGADSSYSPKGEYRKLQTDLGELQHKFSLQSDVLAAKEREIDKLRDELNNTTGTAQRLQRQLRDANFEASSLADQLAEYKNEKQHLGSSVASVVEERNELRAELSRLDNKIQHLENLLQDKEKENEQLVVTNRRLSDLNSFLKRDLETAQEEESGAHSQLKEVQQQLMKTDSDRKMLEEKVKRLEDSLEAEKSKVEATDRVRDQVQRLIKQAELNAEEVKTFQRHKEKQEAEIGKLRKELEKLLKERDTVTEKLKRAIEQEKKMVEVLEKQKQDIARLEQSEYELKNYVCRYEAELFKVEAMAAQHVETIKELEAHVSKIEEENDKLIYIARKMDNNRVDRDSLVKELNSIVKETQNGSPVRRDK